jgi:predicted O-methyltransferase YrrM
MTMLKEHLARFYQLAVMHREQHGCGGVPYEYGEMLSVFVAISGSKKILEVGTGIGYSTACLASGNEAAEIETIDQDELHLNLAKEQWELLGISESIKGLKGKAEDILPTLSNPYDFIFFDGYTPSMKFLIQFERLLTVGGVLITANLYLQDPSGGKYLSALRDEKKWRTGTFGDTAVSVRR